MRISNTKLNEGFFFFSEDCELVQEVWVRKHSPVEVFLPECRRCCPLRGTVPVPKTPEGRGSEDRGEIDGRWSDWRRAKRSEQQATKELICYVTRIPLLDRMRMRTIHLGEISLYDIWNGIYRICGVIMAHGTWHCAHLVNSYGTARWKPFLSSSILHIPLHFNQYVIVRVRSCFSSADGKIYSSLNLDPWKIFDCSWSQTTKCWEDFDTSVVRIHSDSLHSRKPQS
jgi:hypothetical protein